MGLGKRGGGGFSVIVLDGRGMIICLEQYLELPRMHGCDGEST